jgi:HAD superfamily hydrolase (TIGR01490 family)
VSTNWPTVDRPPSAAFFDVDGTLLAETTTYLYAKVLRKRGLIDHSILWPALYHGLQHHFGKLDYGRLVDLGLKSISRYPVIDLERLAYENFKDNVKPRLYAGVVDHINALRWSGAPVVLVTSSPEIVISPLALFLGCADTITTPVRIERGRLVGVGEGPPCYGEGKRYWVRLWAEEHGIDLTQAVAYADNWSDRALLESVGNAVVVNPTGKLKKLARDRHWLVVNARRTSPPSPESH